MKTTDIKAMKELDKTDLKILKLLQQNARIPMTELAEKSRPLHHAGNRNASAAWNATTLSPAITPIWILML